MSNNNVKQIKLPVLYSFRRCPYAIRARLALIAANINVEVREVKLSDKPNALIEISTKATVPVLHLVNGTVIDESLDIMTWAYSQLNEPAGWLWDEDHELIKLNDEFKYFLDRYKYADRYPEKSQQAHCQQCFPFLMQLEARLVKQKYLLGNEVPSFIDFAIMPFVRQFAKVDETWWQNCQFVYVKQWLEAWLADPVFKDAMHAYEPWQQGDTPVYLMTHI